MLKRIKFKNSTLLLMGGVIVCIGVFIGCYEYFVEKKANAFSSMNVKLFEREEPEIIEEQKELKEEEKIEEVKVEETKEEENFGKYLGVLEIPKLNLKHGFYDVENVHNNVDENITVIRSSTLPDESNNNLILAAHSGDCSYCYFDNLYKLTIGDMAYIDYNNFKYSYKIVDIYEVIKNGTVAIRRDYTKSVLTLITCTRGSTTKQTVYILEKQN